MAKRMSAVRIGPSLRSLTGALRSVRTRHLGFAFFWLWMTMFMHGPQLIAWSPGAVEAAVGPLSFAPLLSLTLSSAATMLVVALAAKNRSLVQLRGVRLAAVVLTVAGTVARAFSGEAGLLGWELGPVVMSTAAAGIAGAGTALTMVVWGEYYGCVGVRRSAVYIVLSVLLSSLLYLVAHRLGAPLQVAIMCACPFLAVGLLTRSRKEVGELFPHAEESAPLASLPPKLVLCSVACGVITGLVSGSSALMVDADLTGSDLAGPLAGTAVALLFLAGLACFGEDLDRGFTYRPTLVVMVVGCALLPFAALDRGTQVGTAIVGGGYLLFYMLTWIVYADIAHRSKVPGAPVFAWGRLFAAFGYGAGMLLGAAGLRVLGPDLFTPALISCVTMGALVLTAVFVLDEKGLAPHTSSGGAPSREDPAAALAQSCSLTKRETEVLAHLLKGRSLARIAADLGLSYNTVNSHVANLYAKCGVHSRQELIDKAEGAR